MIAELPHGMRYALPPGVSIRQLERPYEQGFHPYEQGFSFILTRGGKSARVDASHVEFASCRIGATNALQQKFEDAIASLQPRAQRTPFRPARRRVRFALRSPGGSAAPATLPLAEPSAPPTAPRGCVAPGSFLERTL